MILNKIYILILLFACVNYAQPTRRDLDIYKGDSHTLSFEAPYDVSSDSLLFVVKADRDDDTPRVIALRNTAGGGSDSEIRVIYSAVSTILVKLTQINTEGLTAALYVADNNFTVNSSGSLFFTDTTPALTLGDNTYRFDAGTFSTGSWDFKYVRSNSGIATNVADGGTIAHGLIDTPSSVTVTGSVAGEIVTVSGIDGTNITVDIKDNDGSAGTTQTIYWKAITDN